MLDTLEVLCMLTYRDLFNIHTKYVDYLVAKTLIPLRLQNIAGGGSVVENEVRAFLRSMLPYRFRITHGHIVYCSDTKRQPLISSQIDLIVLDTLVPNTLFVLDPETGAEVVPLEAVVGILEIKRTLDKRSLVGDVVRPINGENNANVPQLSFLRKDGQTAKNVGALPFLKKVLFDLNINKTSDIRYVLGGFTVGAGLGGGYLSNPLVGIIALDHALATGQLPNILADCEKNALLPDIDIILSLSGLLAMTASADNTVDVVNPRPKERKTHLIEVYHEKPDAARVLAHSFGFINAFLARSAGRIINPAAYYFNEHLALSQT